MKRSAKRHCGTVLVAALVCLSVVMGLIGYLLLDALRAQRELRRQRDRRQCELLLQAGVDRATVQLAKDEEYHGETWRVATADVSNHGEGRVTIEVSPGKDDERGEVHVIAEYPYGDVHSIRRSRTNTIQPSGKEE